MLQLLQGWIATVAVGAGEAYASIYATGCHLRAARDRQRPLILLGAWHVSLQAFRVSCEASHRQNGRLLSAVVAVFALTRGPSQMP